MKHNFQPSLENTHAKGLEVIIIEDESRSAINWAKNKGGGPWRPAFILSEIWGFKVNTNTVFSLMFRQANNDSDKLAKQEDDQDLLIIYQFSFFFSSFICCWDGSCKG